MKNTLIMLLALTLLNTANAQNISQDKAKFLGEQEQSAEDYIKALTPKARYKTRGIRFNNNPEAKAEPVAAPSVALGVTFAYDSHQLTPQAIEQLRPLGEALNSDQLAKFSFNIDGHTDATGSEHYNLSLSQRRALSVGQHLFDSYGVEVSRLIVQGKGETQLYDTANPEAGINRRVEITTVER